MNKLKQWWRNLRISWYVIVLEKEWDRGTKFGILGMSLHNWYPYRYLGFVTLFSIFYQTRSALSIIILGFNFRIIKMYKWQFEFLLPFDLKPTYTKELRSGSGSN